MAMHDVKQFKIIFMMQYYFRLANADEVEFLVGKGANITINMKEDAGYEVEGVLHIAACRGKCK